MHGERERFSSLLKVQDPQSMKGWDGLVRLRLHLFWLDPKPFFSFFFFFPLALALVFFFFHR